MDLASTLDALGWVLGASLVLLGGYVVGFNWATIAWNSRLRARGMQRQVSSVPIVGPLGLTVGVAIMFRESSLHLLWFWLIDWPTSSLPLVLAWRWRRSRAAQRRERDSDV